jgi:hypothetical protein
MGKLEPQGGYTGSVGKISVYKVRGSDKPIVRTKGGPTKRMIKTRDSFAATRRNNMEFGGRARVASQVQKILRPLKYLGDYNMAGPLNALLRPVQALDTESEHGERNVLLSKDPGLLQGFNLNRRTPFETIITNPLQYTISKEKLTASITIPKLIPGVNFFLPQSYAWYRFMVVFGIVGDVFFNANGYRSIMDRWSSLGLSMLQITDWLNVAPQSPAVTVTFDFNEVKEGVLDLTGENNFSCLLGIGIAFGTMLKGEVEMVKYVGGGKILAMV